MQSRWRRHAELDEQREHVLAELTGLLDPRLAAVVLDDLDRVELRDEVAPGVAGADLGDALEQQREHRDRDVGLDPPGPVVEHRPHAQTALELAPALLDAEELLVPEREIFG